ncbi:fimbria/pilus outer membrane usher protein [Dyella sp. Tek66A03]|uniref:fimbria/pilus outer membrane usher protein n=1 Tax=Dyella sp. Tek66A03 TaxID=3458298 RepID=UPI00403E39AF
MKKAFRLFPVMVIGQLGLADLHAQSVQQGISAEAPAFDAEMLKQRGIDPATVEYLREQPRFASGTHTVTLNVNGHSRGRATVRFDSDNQLCFDRSLLDVAGLKVPAPADTASPEGCLPFLSAYPMTQVEPDPASLALSLVVPTDALRFERANSSGYVTGGTAGVFNYSLNALRSDYANGSSNYVSLNSELGFNAGDWIVRNRRVDTVSNGVATHTNLEAYAQRTFADQRLTLQTGEITLINPVVPLAMVTGVQVATETALSPNTSGVVVEGIAQSPARVEVRQAGAIIYTTVVPAGPFTLRDIRPLNRQSDLDVTVIEADGSERTFTVPSATLSLTPPSAGFSAGVGKVRDFNGGNVANPWVANVGWSGALGRRLTASGGLVAATEYQALGASLNQTLPWTGGQIQGQLIGSNATRDGVRGLQSQVAFGQQLVERLSLQTAFSHQTSGYRTLLDTMVRQTGFSPPTPGDMTPPDLAVIPSEQANLLARYRDQWSMSLGWSTTSWGGLTASYARSVLFDGRNTSRWVASWNKSWRKVSVSANAEWNRGTASNLGNAVYVTASIPLGPSRSLRTSASDRAGDHRLAVNYSERVNDYLSYQVGAERDTQAQVNTNLSVSALPLYTQVDLGYTRDGGGGTTYSGLMRGGIALHSDGVTFSPYPLGDTFAVVAVGDQAGVQVSTPSGPVWTDAKGQAVVAQLAPYGQSPVEVVTKSLPRNADLLSGSATIMAGRGAVEHLRFDLTTTRRALLTATEPDGQVLPPGASVVDESGQLVAQVQGDGLVFLPEYVPGRRLWVVRPDQPRCELHYELPANSDLNVYYETASAVCQPTKE